MRSREGDATEPTVKGKRTHREDRRKSRMYERGAARCLTRFSRSSPLCTHTCAGDAFSDNGPAVVF